MKTADVVMAETTCAPALAAETALPATGNDSTSVKPFAKIIDSAIAPKSKESPPKKDSAENDAKPKKSDDLVVTVPLNGALPTLGPLPDIPTQTVESVPTCDNTLSAAVQQQPIAQGLSTAQIAVKTSVKMGNPVPLPVVISVTSEPAPVRPDRTTTVETSIAPTQQEKPATGPVSSMQTPIQNSPPSRTDDSNDTGLQTINPVNPNLAPAVQPVQSRPAATDGTMIAKQVGSMKTGVKVDKSSTSAEKTLPRRNDSTTAAVETTRSSRNPEAGARFSQNSGESQHQPLESREKSTVVYGPAAAEFKHFDTKVSTDEARGGEVQTSQVEKLSSAISEQVVTLRKVGADTMQAVLRPDRGTEISLHLTVNNEGQVAVIARLERGNFEGLQAHWGELQSSLAQQGVRVGELQSAFSHPLSSQGSSQNPGGTLGQQSQTQRQSPRSPEPPDEPRAFGSMNKAAKAKATASSPSRNRGWEKWA